MIKFVDITWIADKALDVYCELNCKSNDIPKPILSSNSKNINKSVKTVFNDVFNMAIGEYSKKYDRIILAVPCYPITRMSRISILTRFMCNNSEFLSDNGISASQYQEAFEKFISLKCKNEFITDIDEKTVILNGRGILLKDWKKSIIENFGSSLVNTDRDYPFDSNPDFIINFEFDDNVSKFTPLSNENKFKIDTIIKNLSLS